jgi:hypothetical protein
VTVNLRGAMRSFATGVWVMTTYLDEATGRRHDGLMVGSLTSVPLDPRLVREFATSRDARTTVPRTVSATPGTRRRRGPARDRLNRRGTSTSSGRSMATGQPSLITTRCKEHT